jgi:hypothetical protein
MGRVKAEPTPAGFVRGSLACKQLAVTIRTLKRLVAEGMFTDAKTDGGWRLVYADELAAAIREPDPARRRAAVYAVRKAAGRVEKTRAR